MPRHAQLLPGQTPRLSLAQTTSFHLSAVTS
jgi:hypothetical protein